MNNKGFTLIELLATVVILGLIMGIATTGAVNYINSSKKKSEHIFVEKTGKLIEEYISLKGMSLNMTSNTYTFTKLYGVGTNTANTDGSDNVIATELTNVKLSALIDQNLVDINSFINPLNKEKCLIKVNNTYQKNPNIRVFKDEDLVYYYYVDLSETNTSCNISKDNGILTNIPENLCTAIGKKEIDSNRFDYFNTDKRKCILQ